MVRWSGPGNIFGFIARINREQDISVRIPLLKKASEEVTLNLIEIDGIKVNIKRK